jgi:hypothetical protein
MLVQYFTALGFDTGFTLEQATTDVDPISLGGLEHSLGRTVRRGRPLPYVAKSPYFGRRLGEHLDQGDLDVRACIIPLRELRDAAESRRQVSARAEDAGLDPHDQPGGVLRGRAASSRRQEDILAQRLYELLHVLSRHGVPTYLLHFPTFVNEPGALFLPLGSLLSEHDVTREESDAAHRLVADADRVHTFGT